MYTVCELRWPFGSLEMSIEVERWYDDDDGGWKGFRTFYISTKKLWCVFCLFHFMFRFSMWGSGWRSFLFGLFTSVASCWCFMFHFDSKIREKYTKNKRYTSKQTNGIENEKSKNGKKGTQTRKKKKKCVTREWSEEIGWTFVGIESIILFFCSFFGGLVWFGSVFGCLDGWSCVPVVLTPSYLETIVRPTAKF